MEIARYEKRVIAYLIDLLVAFVPALGLFIFLYFFFEPKLTTSIPSYFFALAAELLTYLFYVFLNFFFLVFSKGYTLGMLIIGTKVIHLSKRPPTVREIFLKTISIGLFPMVIVNVIYMLIVHTEKTIFDRISETIVVDARLSRRLEGHYKVKK